MVAIHIPYASLELRAGQQALSHIRQKGLKPLDVGIIPGAAGGPKGLGLQGLDLALFGHWFNQQPRERQLIGSSIGAWRMACACLPDPTTGIRLLGELYTQQHFPRGSSMQSISQSCRIMLEQLLQGREAQILANPHYRLNILLVNSHGLLSHDHKGKLALGLSRVIGANLLNRQYLSKHFQRIVMHDPRSLPLLKTDHDFATRHHPLTPSNLRQALLASGSIPLVMQAINEIPGVGNGSFRDGGLIDYHLDLPYANNDIVLYPHFSTRIIPGWFDKGLPWRKANRHNLRNLLLLAPSQEYLKRLPLGKLPDRSDFKRFQGNDAARQRYWLSAIAESQRLGDDFLELCNRGKLAEYIQPF